MDSAFFAGLIGHGELKKRLAHLLSSDRMPHAAVFAGPAGLGKSAFARAVASAMVGRSVLQTWDEAGGAMIRDGADVFCLAPVGKGLKVEQFRHLQEALILQGDSGSKRVCVIRHAETMNAEFSNRMLKTLEEPPAGVYFILLTDQPDLLLATIRSRCTVFSFQPIAAADLLDGLARCCGGSREQYAEAVRWSGGNLQAALDFLSGRGTKGVTAALQFLQILATHPSPYAKWLTLVAAVDEAEMKVFIRVLMAVLRDLAVLRAGLSQSALCLQGCFDELVQLLPYWDDAAVFTLLRVPEESWEAMTRNVNGSLIRDHICLGFLQAKGGV